MLQVGDPELKAAAESAQQFVVDQLSNVADSWCARLQDSGILYLTKASAALARRVGSPAQAPALFPIVPEADAEEDFGCAASETS